MRMPRLSDISNVRVSMPKPRAVAVWGAAWAGGLSVAVLLGIAGLPYGTLAVSVAAIVGVVLVGLPIAASARAAGSRRPSREAVAVGIACALAVIVYAYIFSPGTDPTINTAATIAERNARFARPHLPDELVWGFGLSLLGPLVGGMVSSWLAVGSRRMSWQASADSAVYAITLSGAILLGLIVLAILGPILLAASGAAAVGLPTALSGLFPVVLDGFLAGGMVGGIATGARRRLQHSFA